MEFALSKEQNMIQQSIKKYLDEMGGTSIARSFINDKEDIYVEIWNRLSELGYLGINVVEEYGGIGEGMLTLVPIFEELGRALVPGPYAETLALAVPLLQKYGTEEQKKKYLPQVALGNQKFTLAFFDKENSTYHPNSINMSAEIVGDEVILNGEKTLVPNAEMADTFIVPVRTGRDQNNDGITLILVNSADVDLHYQSINSFEQTRSLSRITFHNIRVSKNQIIGEINSGWKMLQDTFDELNIALCASMVGGLEKTVSMSVDYANTRSQFGQPIGRFQALKHKIVDMKRDLESARSLTYYAAAALDTNSQGSKLAISCARSFTTEAFINGAGHNIHIHGGMGVTWEYDCHLFLKRARSLEHYIDSSSECRERIADWLVQEEGVLLEL